MRSELRAGTTVKAAPAPSFRQGINKSLVLVFSLINTDKYTGRTN